MHPTENNAQHVLSVEQSAREVAAIQAFANQDGLLFFYRGKQRLDQALAPSIAAFAKIHRMALIPVSVDGKSLAIFPKSQSDHGQAKALQIHYFPALVLVNPKTGAHQAVAYGFIAQDELKRRFLNMATQFKRAV